MSDTPKTDAAAFFADVRINETKECVTAEFSRGQERRIAKLEAGLRMVLETDEAAMVTMKTQFDMDPSPEAVEFNKKVREALKP